MDKEFRYIHCEPMKQIIESGLDSIPSYYVKDASGWYAVSVVGYMSAGVERESVAVLMRGMKYCPYCGKKLSKHKI